MFLHAIASLQHTNIGHSHYTGQEYFLNFASMDLWKVGGKLERESPRDLWRVIFGHSYYYAAHNVSDIGCVIIHVYICIHVRNIMSGMVYWSGILFKFCIFGSMEGGRGNWKGSHQGIFGG